MSSVSLNNGNGATRCGANVVYTAIFGGYDRLAPIRDEYREGWQCICFTDDAEQVPRGWKAIELSPSLFPDLPPVAIAKWIKIQPSTWLMPALDAVPRNVLWIDGNVSVGKSLNYILGRFPTDKPFVTQHHTAAHSFYGEIQAARGFPRPYIPETRAASEYMEQDYRERGFEDDDCHANHNNVILRRPCASNTILEDAWWSEFQHYRVWRDQISLRAAAQLTGIEFEIIPDLLRDGLKWGNHHILKGRRDGNERTNKRYEERLERRRKRNAMRRHV